MIGRRLSHYEVLEKIGSGGIPMEHIQGVTLRERLATDPIEPQKMLALAI